MRVSFEKWNEIQCLIETWLKAENYKMIEKLVNNLVEEGYDETHVISLIRTVEKKILLDII